MISNKQISDLNFLTFKSGKYTYIRAYKNVWVPAHVDEQGREIKGQSRTAYQKHAGALRPNGAVKLSKNFLKAHPEFMGVDWFYLNNELIDEDTYYERVPPSQEETPSEPTMDELLDMSDFECEIPIEEEDSSLSGDDNFPERKDANWLANYCGMHLMHQMQFHKTLAKFLPHESVVQLLVCVLYKAFNNETFNVMEEWGQQQYLPKEARCLDSRRISELLKKINSEMLDEFYKERFIKSQDQHFEVTGRRPIRYCALDSTAINTQADVVEKAYGHPKQDLGMEQVNLMMVYDQLTGEIVYAHLYDGSVNDKASFTYILNRMKLAGFPIEELMLVTDRGYQSNANMTYLINENVHFLTGCVVGVNTVYEKYIEQYAQSLRIGIDNMIPGTSICAKTIKERWAGSGKQKKTIYTHVYCNQELAAQICQQINTDLHKIEESYQENKKPPEYLLKEYARCFKEILDPDSNPHMKPKKIWVRDKKEIQRRINRAGCFVLASDSLSDSFDALTLYNMRTSIEESFKQLKVHVGGERLRAGQATYMGRVFVFLLATALRLKIRHQFKQYTSAHPEQTLKIPGDSLSKLFKRIDLPKIRRQSATGNRWVSDLVPKKTRDLIEACFGLNQLPKTIQWNR